MLEFSTNTQIGLGLTVMGIAFLFLGIVFLFDKGLLAIGNLMFLTGLSFIIGFRKIFSFFFQWHKLKGTFAFFVGIFILLAGHPIIGVLVELCGFYLLFRSFIPTALSYATSFLPFYGTIKNQSVI